ncbi:Glucose-methanol-choline oxidoreductase [Penicillium ucsense]|uniref:glucose oxidase n=1 Tax=Penicillium ucsense TaxID=2839758 RepID=A0A8J8WHN9_9EURO|nr:Glucose-methanol-choline oxidoreductase [Penicillium ucsense]KAF7726636.1 Glucose-methanol-choline oxidoreductase [Penicillium ucsense]
MFLLPSLALAALSLGVSGSPTSSPHYDFVIVGGGTSGLVVANRLSELHNVTVAVIEAGESVLNNFNVTNVMGYSTAFGTQVDWAYQTENQTYADGLQQTVRAGKALGGTSTINGNSYTRAEDLQIDTWEVVGNKGWNWKNLLTYYKKSEGFEVPTEDQIAHGANYNASYHGLDGPLKVGWPYSMTNSSVFHALKDTMEKMGMNYNPESEGGKMVGFTVHPDTVDREKNVREDAARAYYWPYETRSNLKIISNTRGNKIIWANSTAGGDAVAAGVEVTTEYGTEIIYVDREVILSAGALRSPALLELSGVGNPALLGQHGIPVKVNLTTVGENLQDQTNNALSWAGVDTVTGLATFSALPSVNQLYGDKADALAASVKSQLASYARTVAQASNGVLKEANLLEAFNLQHDMIFKSQVPYTEIVFSPLGQSFAVEYWPLLPFSRGHVHIRSANASDLPAINPNYFMFAQDAEAQVTVAKYIRKSMATAPVSGLIREEQSPGLEVLPTDASRETWDKWVKAHYRTNYHPVGTLSMLPREKGGVVSPELKVYGTKNVRVVDASVLPFQLCGHLVSTLYAVAEKASDIIKESY